VKAPCYSGDMRQPINNVEFRVFGVIFISSLVGVLISSFVNFFLDFYFYAVWVGSIFSVFSVIFFGSFVLRRIKLGKATQMYQGCIAFLLTFSFLSSVPLTIDRSLSVWILSYTSNAGAENTALTKAEIHDRSAKFFFGSNVETLRRLDEQERLGNILIGPNGSVQITSKGSFQAYINRIISKVFFLNSRYADGR
jgi:hypothetical protein